MAGASRPIVTFRPLRPGRPACGGSEATARRRLVGPGDHGMDFASEDSMDFGAYNRITWAGLMGDKPYPAAPTGVDLRQGREEILAR